MVELSEPQPELQKEAHGPLGEGHRHRCLEDLVAGLGFVAAPATRDQNLRGIYWKVVAADDAGVGSAIEVFSRPAWVR